MSRYFEVKNLCYAYLRQPLCLKDVSFSASQNDNVLVLGLDDKGKSTLLKTISGFDGKYFGKVMLESVDIRTISDKEKLFSLILGYPTLIPGSIKKNLDFLFETMGEPIPSRKEICDLLNKVNLVNDLDVNIKKLSEFEKFKLCFLRAYIKNSKVIFIDDIFDYNFTEEEVKELNEILSWISKDRLMFCCVNDKNFAKYKGLICNFGWTKTLYLNMAKLYENNSLDGFLKNPIDLDALAFNDYFLQKDCFCVFDNGDYFLSIDDVFVKLDKKLYSKFEALKLTDKDDEDLILAHNKNLKPNYLMNNDINKMLLRGEILLFSKLDRSRIN